MQSIISILQSKRKKLAILIDPDKTNRVEELTDLVKKIEFVKPAFIFVGGSTVDQNDFSNCISTLKELTNIPVVIFPGGHQQLSEKADGILFLSLISGRNPDYLIGHQVQSAHRLKKMAIETIPTGYLLIDGGNHSSVAYVSQTTPIPRNQNSIAVNTAIAGETLGFSAIFMDAGSGANHPVPVEMIKDVKNNISVPLIIGGGMTSTEQIGSAFEAGADVVVIGNKIEQEIDFLLDLEKFGADSSTKA